MTRDFEDLIATVKEQNLRLDAVVTDQYPFTQAAKAFSDFDAGAADMLKVMLQF